MAINVSETEYAVKAFLPSGKALNLTNVVQNMSWSEQEGQIAQRASITFANIKTEDGLVSELLKLCVKIIITANGTPVFDGTIWDYQYESAVSKNLTVMCYDKMIYLAQSKEHYYYTSGKTTKAIIGDICGRWGITLAHESSSITHTKTLFKGTCISDNILTVQKEADDKAGKKSVVLFADGKLCIREKGKNKDVYIFNAGQNVEKTDYRISMDSLVTKVIIMGKEDKDGRAPVKGEVTGKTEFGLLQEVEYLDGDKSMADAKTSAQKRITDNGNPKETMSITCADVPFIRKGDKVKIAAGNLLGYFYATGVSHDATERKMVIDLER